VDFFQISFRKFTYFILTRSTNFVMLKSWCCEFSFLFSNGSFMFFTWYDTRLSENLTTWHLVLSIVVPVLYAMTITLELIALHVHVNLENVLTELMELASVLHVILPFSDKIVMKNVLIRFVRRAVFGTLLKIVAKMQL